MKQKIKYRRLDARDREYIAHNYAQGRSISSIARFLNVHKSTVSREIKRNSHRHGYTANHAQMLSGEQAQWKLEKRKKRFTSRMKQHIRHKLRCEQWSPEQIVEDCRRRGISMVGITTIYKYIHQDKKAGGDLYRHTRHRLKHRRRRSYEQSSYITKKERRSILTRPEYINAQTRKGDMEMDLIIGKGHKEAILTLVDRLTGYLIIEHLAQGKNAKSLAKALIKRIRPLVKMGKIRSITTDNGCEFSEFEFIERKLGIPIYFARPYRSTDKPHIEHANKLIRQYLPKGISFANITQADCKRIQDKLNHRPRKKLGYKTPLQIFNLNLPYRCTGK
ncbi:MAG: IS30 family transposase [Bacteroidales bacterium]|nr:IS30 family transposase [Bacteroidales bacterium]